MGDRWHNSSDRHRRGQVDLSPRSDYVRIISCQTNVEERCTCTMFHMRATTTISSFAKRLITCVDDSI
jgi:hypothetical protein